MINQTNWLDRYGFSASKNINLPEIEPVSPIERSLGYINDIDYDKVSEYEDKIFNKNNGKNENENKIISEYEDKIFNKNNSKNENENKIISEYEDKIFNKNNGKNENEVKNDKTEKNNANAEKSKINNDDSLTDEEKAVVEKLKARDTEVKVHEQTHIAVAGDLVVSGPSYTYQQGPDGKQYAVGGEVSIDTSRDDSPDKTISKMQRVIAAALAPAEPSSADYSVAATARQIISDAKTQSVQEKDNKTIDTDKNNNSNSKTNTINENNNSNSKTNTINENNNSINNNSTPQASKLQNNINQNNNRLSIYQNSNTTFSTSKGLYTDFVA